jgi:hypothetical protein
MFPPCAVFETRPHCPGALQPHHIFRLIAGSRTVDHSYPPFFFIESRRQRRGRLRSSDIKRPIGAIRRVATANYFRNRARPTTRNALRRRRACPAFMICQARNRHQPLSRKIQRRFPPSELLSLNFRIETTWNALRHAGSRNRLLSPYKSARRIPRRWTGTHSYLVGRLSLLPLQVTRRMRDSHRDNLGRWSPTYPIGQNRTKTVRRGHTPNTCRGSAAVSSPP